MKRLLSFPQNVFHKRALLMLCAGELVSTTGSALTTLAASIQIYQITGSALRVSLLLVSAALPGLLVGIFAGVIVDRVDRKRLLMISDLGRAALSFSIPLLVSINSNSLYAVVFFSSALGQFFNPAHESILADIATERERTSINAMMALSGFGATAVGFAAGGYIAASCPLAWAFYLDGFTYLFSAMCIRCIPASSQSVQNCRGFGAIWSDLQSGGRSLIGNTSLRALLFASVPVVFSFGLWNALLLPFDLHTLHASASIYGLQEGLTAVGFTAGCLTVMRLGNRLSPGRWMLISFIGMGTVMMYFAFCTEIPLAIELVILSGLLNAPYSIERRSVIQSNTQPETRGRINSLFMVTRDAVYLAGMTAAGLADTMDIRILLSISGLLLLVAAFILKRLDAYKAPLTRNKFTLLGYLQGWKS